ncbi:MAG: hypothetical protein ACJ746_21230 [Bryobacteraceae bacterium]
MHSLTLRPQASPIRVIRPTGTTDLSWFRQVTVAVRPNLPKRVRGPIYFIGDPETLAPDKIAGAVVVRLGTPRIRKARAAAPGNVPDGAAAIITIDSLGGPALPISPLPYAAVVSLRDAGSDPGANSECPVALRFNPADAELLFAGSGHTLREVLTKSESGDPLPNFPLVGSLEAELTVAEKNFTSDNGLAVLPGSDPSLRNEYVALSAHLDGYGLGEARRETRSTTVHLMTQRQITSASCLP